MSRQLRFLVIGAVFGVVLFTEAGRVDAWHWHRQRVYVPYVPAVPVGGVAVRGGVGREFYYSSFRGPEFFLPGAYRGAEFFTTGAEFYSGMPMEFVTTRRAQGSGEGTSEMIERAVSKAVKSMKEASQDESPGGVPGTAGTRTGTCAGLGTRIDKLTERIGALEVKVDRIESYIAATQAAKEKKEFAAWILEQVNDQRRTDLGRIADALSLIRPTEAADKGKLDQLIQQLRR